jgi:hypothetical protein
MEAGLNAINVIDCVFLTLKVLETDGAARNLFFLPA